MNRIGLVMALCFGMGCAPKVPAPLGVAAGPLAIDRDALPGGTLRVLHTATVLMRESDAVAAGGKEESSAPVSSMLFVHPTYGAMLIDAGYGRATMGEEPDYPSRFVQKLLGLKMQRPMADALADVDMQPSDVRQIFVTHLHHDHSGGVADFPKAVLRSQDAEWRAAQKRRSLKGYEPEPFLGHPYAAVVFDGDAVGPIPRSHDVFGDSSLIALPAVGHTVGHTMYLVNLPTGSWLFAGDAAWVDANWTGEQPRPKGFLARKFVDDDWRVGVESLHAIRWFAAQDGVTVVSGHEPNNLARFSWPDEL